MTDEPQGPPATPEQSAVSPSAAVADSNAMAPKPPRRPYAPPLIESGEAFERVQLQSGTGFGDPIDCPPQ